MHSGVWFHRAHGRGRSSPALTSAETCDIPDAEPAKSGSMRMAVCVPYLVPVWTILQALGSLTQRMDIAISVIMRRRHVPWTMSDRSDGFYVNRSTNSRA